MRVKIFLLIFFTTNSFLIAQTTFISLPIVGDTIDKSETDKYVLFEEIENFSFDYSILSSRISDTILTHYGKTDTIEIKVNKIYIEKMMYNISKLNLYYQSINNPNPNQEVTNNLNYIANPNNKAYANEQAKLDSVLNVKPHTNAEIKKKNAQKYFTPGKRTTNDKRTDTEKRLERFSTDPRK